MTWYDELQQATFAGMPFQVRSTEVGSGFVSATEMQAGRGHRARPIAKGLRVYRFEAYFTGERVLARTRELVARCDAGPGLLVHPHFGAVDAVAQQWSVSFEGGGVIDFATLSIELVETEIAGLLEVTEPETPTDLPTVTETFVDQAATFIDEDLSAQELRQAAPALEVTVAPEEDGYYQAATAALLSQATPGLPGTPSTIAALGVALRRADAGQLAPSEPDAVAALLLRTAARTDSLVLMNMRAEWLAYVRAAGSAAIGQSTAGGGRLLPAVALAAGVDVDVVAGRNRGAVVSWFARGEVRL